MNKEDMAMLFSKMENFVSTKTVVGEAVHIGDVILVPLVDVTLGMGAGGGGAPDDKKSESGGGGFGAKMSPTAVVAIVNGTAQLINVKNQDSVNKLIDMVPGILSKFGSMFGKKEESTNESVPAENGGE